MDDQASSHPGDDPPDHASAEGWITGPNDTARRRRSSLDILIEETSNSPLDLHSITDAFAKAFEQRTRNSLNCPYASSGFSSGNWCLIGFRLHSSWYLRRYFGSNLANFPRFFARVSIFVVGRFSCSEASFRDCIFRSYLLL